MIRIARHSRRAEKGRRGPAASALIVCLALFALAAAARSAAASYANPVLLRDLACRADAIVEGTVRDVTVSQTPQGRFRLSTIAVARVVKAADGQPRAGDAVIDRSFHALYGGHPDYRPGQRVVSFLVRVPGTPYWRTLNDGQGKVPVADGRAGWGDGAPEDRFLADLAAILADPAACRPAPP